MIGNDSTGVAGRSLQSGNMPAAGASAAGQRPRLRALRAAMTPEQRQSAGERIAALLRAAVHAELAGTLAPVARRRPVVLAAFWPIGEEPDLRPALAAWASDARLLLALPVVVQRNAPLAFHQWTPASAMAAGDYGIPVPLDGPALRPDIVLVPALGFTDEAHRIGYGGGFYDRTLAGLRQHGEAVIAWGVAYACGRLPPGVHTPAGHDMALEGVATEAGWVGASAR
jgi:5-formyltetrahydrofolate cyclo-ligase